MSDNDKSQRPTGDGGTGTPGGPTGATAVAAPQPPQPPAPPPGPPAKPQPKNPGMVTCTIDGKEVVVKPGTNMVDAAKLVGSDIPYYCYHPRLSIAANCRMCLVEISTAPKLVPACQTALAEGMAVKTNTPKVKDQQRATMEFLLLNHPVDCSICDQAGECKLQDYYMRYDFKPSRLTGAKVMKDKRKVLGPLVVLDQERCILCTRCVRFMDEVPKEPQLGVFGRGSHERIDIFPGKALDSNYSGNVVDICPVGALLNRDFRFRARAWFLSAAASVCTGCSRGCSTFADFFGQDTYRYRPRENEQINKSWMCDVGRLSYKQLNLERVQAASVGRGAERQLLTREDAVRWAAEKLQPLAGGVAVLASPVASTEDLLGALTFAKEHLGAKAVYVGGRPMGQGDHYLMTGDKNPNRRGLEWVAKGLGLTLQPFDELTRALGSGKVKALWAVGGEVPVDPATFAQSLGGVELLIVQAMNENAFTAAAHLVLPASTHVEDEGSFVNQDGIIQRFRKAYPAKFESQPHWKWAADLTRAFGSTTVYGSAREVFLSLANRVPELATFDWDRSAPPARLAKGINPLPTGADGRPPGYREVGVPRVRGL